MRIEHEREKKDSKGRPGFDGCRAVSVAVAAVVLTASEVEAFSEDATATGGVSLGFSDEDSSSGTNS